MIEYQVGRGIVRFAPETEREQVFLSAIIDDWMRFCPVIVQTMGPQIMETVRLGQLAIADVPSRDTPDATSVWTPRGWLCAYLTVPDKRFMLERALSAPRDCLEEALRHGDTYFGSASSAAVGLDIHDRVRLLVRVPHVVRGDLRTSTWSTDEDGTLMVFAHERGPASLTMERLNVETIPNGTTAITGTVAGGGNDA